MPTDTPLPQQQRFQRDLSRVNQSIDALIADIHTDLASEDAHVSAAIAGALELLGRGGKRLRGVLTLIGYSLYSKEDSLSIVDVGAAIEAFHTYILIFDDIADTSLMRRGGPTVHRSMQAYLKERRIGKDYDKLGTEMAEMAALYLQHKAQERIANLSADATHTLRALCALNQGLARTGIGQLFDFVSSALPSISKKEILKIATYKTAYYSVLLPLQVGAAFAGATDQQLTLFKDYAVHTGLAFQLRDDVIGLFGDEATIGKSPMSDIEEGKQTLLIHHALLHANEEDEAFLRRVLGRPSLTEKNLTRCREIVRDTGALAALEDIIEDHLQKAVTVLEQAPRTWPADQVSYLRDIADYCAYRTK